MDNAATPRALRSTVPVLQTARLTLRAHVATDFADCAAMWADPQIARYIGGTPFSAAQSWSKMLRYAGLWSLVGFGYWAIVENATRRFVGEIGFADFKRDLHGALTDLPEMGWAIVSTAQGQGYASEAVRAAAAWGDEHFAGHLTTCIISPANIASLRVAQKVGFVAFANTVYNDVPLTIFRRDSRRADPRADANCLPSD